MTLQFNYTHECGLSIKRRKRAKPKSSARSKRLKHYVIGTEEKTRAEAKAKARWIKECESD